MTDRVLTDERLGELRALLEDEQRLNAEYPKVADYVDMVPRLLGTGDERVDGAFDLRLIHYMIGGNVDTTNPYWDIVAPAVSERDGRRQIDGGSPTGSARLAYAEMLLQSVYAYAIPSPETLAWAARFCEGRSVVEVGAGRGYWAAQLAHAGLVVAAFDSEPPDQMQNISFPTAAGQNDVWHPVESVTSLDECMKERADDVLFLCWPPGWGNTMAVDALREFDAAGGERLIYIGEPKGGMNATDEFFESLQARWSVIEEDPTFVRWWNVSDVAQGWRRK